MGMIIDHYEINVAVRNGDTWDGKPAYTHWYNVVLPRGDNETSAKYKAQELRDALNANGDYNVTMSAVAAQVSTRVDI